jgi:MFS-type transporter involved in bile tolerance (Atg22 family)
MWEGDAEWKAYTFLSVLLLAGLLVMTMLKQESESKERHVMKKKGQVINTKK